MELGEIIRIQDNVLTFLSPRDASHPKVVFSDILTETLPRDVIIDLEQTILTKVIDSLAKSKRVKRPKVIEALYRGDFSNHYYHKYLLDGFDGLAALDIRFLLVNKGKRINTVLKENAESENRESVESWIHNVQALGISLSKKQLEGDIQRTTGAMFEALNNANGRYVGIVDDMPLIDLMLFLQHERQDYSEFLKHVWGCVASERITRNYALRYVRSDQNLIQNLLSPDGKTPVLLINTLPNLDEESLRRYTQDINHELIEEWIKRQGIRKIVTKLEEGLAQKEEEARQREKGHAAEIKDRDVRYNEAKKRIAELESEQGLEKTADLEEENVALKAKVQELETRVKETEELAEVFADDASNMEEVSAKLQKENTELRSQIEEPVVNKEPAYIIQNGGLKANVERAGFNYELVCALVVCGFKWGRYSNANRLSDTSIKKNVRGKVENNLMQHYDRHFRALMKANVILKGAIGGYSLNTSLDTIRDPYFRGVVKGLIEMKRELEN